MKESIPPLPELEISKSTAKLFNQAVVDSTLRYIYEHRPDFFKRMAEREDDFIGETHFISDKPYGPHDLFVMEFHEYLIKFIEKEIDVTKKNEWDSIYWETRRRARLMYGMSI